MLMTVHDKIGMPEPWLPNVTSYTGSDSLLKVGQHAWRLEGVQKVSEV